MFIILFATSMLVIIEIVRYPSSLFITITKQETLSSIIVVDVYLPSKRHLFS